MSKDIDNICQILAERDYKLTPQRKIIVETFLEHGERHLSAEEIYSLVKAKHPEIGMATVYRTLDLLAELGILQKMNFGDGRSRYEFSNQDEHHHQHLICLSCGDVLEFADDLLESLEKAIGEATKFKITDHQLKFYGYCKKCQ